MHDLMEDFLDDVESSKARSTYSSRKTDVRKFDEWLVQNHVDFLDVEPRHIHQFLREQGETLSDNTIDSRYNSLHMMYEFLTGVWDVIEESPMEDLTLSDYTGNGNGSKHDNAEIVYLKPDEKESLTEYVPDPKLRNELLIRLMWHTGVRRGELVNIELEDIDEDTRSIDIYGEKTSEWRVVYYQPSLDTLLRQWIDVHRKSYITSSGPYLFPSDKSDQLDSNAVSWVVREAAKNAGIQEVLYIDAKGHNRYRVTPHALRHGHAVQALKSGIDPRTVQKHLGHSDLNTTMQYLQLIDEDVRESYQKFGVV